MVYLFFSIMTLLGFLSTSALFETLLNFSLTFFKKLNHILYTQEHIDTYVLISSNPNSDKHLHYKVSILTFLALAGFCLSSENSFYYLQALTDYGFIYSSLLTI